MNRRTHCLLAAVLLGTSLVGCEHRFFSAHGELSSDGGGLGTWSSTPRGCTRDPLDGAPAGKSMTEATFLWQDPRIEERMPNPSRGPVPEAPLRLEVQRADGRLAAVLYTVRNNGPVALDGTVCRNLELDSHDIKPQIAGGHPAMAGRLRIDCRVMESHVRGDIRFSGCEF